MDKHNKRVGLTIFRHAESGRYSVERKHRQERHGSLWCSFNPYQPHSLDYALRYVGATRTEQRDLIPYIHNYYHDNGANYES